MYVTIADFVAEWRREAEITEKVLDGLSDESLSTRVYPEGRTLGRIAWHFTSNIPEYLQQFGLQIDEVDDAEHVPHSAKHIADTFRKVSNAAAQALSKQWTDEHLREVQHAFGRQETNAQIVMGLIKHIVHHRGQITVLMRQAGLKPYGVYGPPKEDWAQLGVMVPPL